MLDLALAPPSPPSTPFPPLTPNISFTISPSQLCLLPSHPHYDPKQKAFKMKLAEIKNYQCQETSQLRHTSRSATLSGGVIPHGLHYRDCVVVQTEVWQTTTDGTQFHNYEKNVHLENQRQHMPDMYTVCNFKHPSITATNFCCRKHAYIHHSTLMCDYNTQHLSPQSPFNVKGSFQKEGGGKVLLPITPYPKEYLL